MMGIVVNCIASVSLAALVVISCAGRGYALEESDKIVAAAFEYEISRHLPDSHSRTASSFCLMMGGGIELREIEPSDRRVGNGASNDVVAALRKRGYDVFSSNDCVYRGFDILSRSSSRSSILIGVRAFKYEGQEAPIISISYTYGGMQASCGEETLKLRRRNGDFEVIESKMTLIC